MGLLKFFDRFPHKTQESLLGNPESSESSENPIIEYIIDEVVIYVKDLDEVIVYVEGD